MPDSQPDLLSCSAETLGNYLLESRFNANAETTAKFLRATADRVIADSIVRIEDAIDIGDPLHSEVTVSSLQPRGKLQLTIGSHGVRMGLGEAVAGFMLRPNTIKGCFVFPKPEECRKSKSNASDMVAFALSEEIEFKGKKHSEVCFQLPARPKAGGDEAAGVQEDHTSKWMVLFQKALNFGDYERVYHPKNPDYGNLNSFQSYADHQISSTTAEMPYVSCYHTVHDGVVFPLNSAFVFYKPIRLFLLDDLSVSIESTSSRYISILFERQSGERVELSNISAHERTGLQHFLAENGKSGFDGQSEVADEVPEPSDSTRTSRKRKAATQASTINKRMVWKTEVADDESEEKDVNFDEDETDEDEDDDEEEDGEDSSGAEVEGETDEEDPSDEDDE